jgi:hypothetical protein
MEVLLWWVSFPVEGRMSVMVVLLINMFIIFFLSFIGLHRNRALRLGLIHQRILSDGMAVIRSTLKSDRYRLEYGKLVI